MSRTIDERIVEMQFNNQQFEQNVKVSMGTLDKLKQALNFGRGKNGFNDLNASARKFDMSGVANAVTEVHSKFSALEIVGVTALVNIANQAINTGKHMLNSLTIAPISQGFQEYELKMGSVQTIVASTGEKLSTVNKYLEDLNTYSDKTIYSFKDMTSNIGKFTNAGVKLKDAVSAIKGVSNVAAVSGANAAEASRAMYNFSQALSSGAVKLIDWKSIENANMSTVEFKETLLDTAVALGTVTKEAGGYKTTTTNLQGKVSDVFTSTKGFNEALAHQWMTTEVLTQALELYSTDVRELSKDERTAYEERLRRQGFTTEQIKQYEELGIKAADAATEVKTFSMLIDTLQEAVGSGWAQTWEILFGDFDEAKKLWTEINDVVGGFIDRTSDARNELLKAWKGGDIQGRKKLIQGLSNAFQVLRNVIKPVGDAIAILFPPLTAKKLGDLTDKFVAFTEKAKKATENFPMNIFGKNDAGGSKTSSGLDKVTKKTEKVGKAVKETTESIEKLRDVVRAVIRGDYGNGIPGAREDALKKAGFDPQQVQDYVNKVHELGNGKWNLSDEIMAAAEESLGYTERSKKEAEEAAKAAEKIEENVSDVVQNTNFLTSILVSVGKGIQNAFGSAVKIVTAFTSAFGDAKSTVTVTRKSVLDFIKSMDEFAGKLKVSDKTLKRINKSGKDFFITVKTLTALVVKFVLENMPSFLDIANSVLQIIGKIVLGFASLVISVSKTIVTSKTFAKIFDALGFVFRQLAKAFDALNKLIDYFGTKLSKARKYMSDYMKEHETARKLTELMSKAFNRVSEAAVDFGKKIGGKFGVNSLEDFKKKVDNLIDTLGKDFLIPGFEKFVKLIDDLFDGRLKLPTLSEALGTIGDAIKNFVDKQTIFDGFEKAIGTIGNSFKGLGDLTKDFSDGTLPTFSEFGSAFSDFIDGIATNLSEIDWTGVAALVGEIGIMFIAFNALANIARAIRTGKGLVDAATALMGTVKTFFGNVNDILTNFTVAKTWTAKFKTIAKAVLILAASIWLVADALLRISALDQPTLIRSGIAIGAIILALVAMEVALSKFGNGIEIGTVASVVVFAIAIKLMVSAFMDMAELLLAFEGRANLLQDAFWDLVVIMGVMVGVVAALGFIQKKIGPMGGFKNMLTIIAFVLALKLLVGVLQDLAKADFGNMWELLIKLGTALFSLAVMVNIASMMAGAGSGIGVLALVLAVKLLISVFDDIAKLDVGAVLKNIGALIIIAGMLAYLAVMCRLAGEGGAKAGVGILLVAVALYLMVGVIQLIGSMKPEVAIKGILGLLFLMVGIGFLFATMMLVQNTALQAGVAILLIALALNLLVLPIMLLGSMRPDVAAKGVIAILALMVGISGMLNAMMLAGEKAVQAGAAILMIAAAITALVYVVYILGNIESSKLFKAIVAIGLLSVILGVLMAMSKHTEGSSWTGILAVAGAVMLLAGALFLLANLPMKNLGAAMICLLAIGSLMTTLMEVSQYTEKAALGKIIVMGIVIGALAAIMALIASKLLVGIDGSNMLKQFAAITIAVVGIGAIMAVISALKITPADAAMAGASIDAFVFVIGVFAAALTGLMGELNKLTNGSIVSDIQEGAKVLNAIGTAIGSFIKGIADVFASGDQGTQQAAPEVVEETKSFAERLNELVDTLVAAAQKLEGNEASLESLKKLVGIVGEFAKAEFINGISEFLGGGKTDFGALGTQLGKLADGLISFSKKMGIARIDPKLLNMTLNFAKKLAELYGMDALKSGGFIQQILGESIGLDKLGDQLYELASGLTSYAMVINIEDFNEEKIKASEQLLKFLATVYGMPALKKGGFLGQILGNSIGLDTLGSQLTALAWGLHGYVDKINMVDFDQDKLDKSKRVLKFIAEIGDMPGLKRGGFLQDLVGEAIPFDVLGEQLEKLGEGFKLYIDKLNEAEIDMTQATKSQIIMDMIGVMASTTIPKSGGFLQFFTGGSGLNQFADSLPILAKGIVGYINTIKEASITDADVAVSTRITNIVLNIANACQKVDGGKDIRTLSSELTAYAKALKDFFKDYLEVQASLTQVDTLALRSTMTNILSAVGEFFYGVQALPDDINLDFLSVIEKLKQGIDDITQMGADATNLFNNTIGSLKTALDTKLTELQDVIDRALNDSATKFTTSGAQMANNLADAFSSGPFVATVERIVKEAEDFVSGFDTLSRWRDCGNALSVALGDGITGRVDAVVDAGKDVAKDGADGAESTKDDWISAGESIASGLASGISRGESGVIDAAVTVAINAYEAAKQALDINSPSKLFAKLGAGIDEGYVKGMEDNENLVTSKSVDLVKQMINSSQDALYRLGDLIDSDVIDDPTITPVLDLSQIQNGANRLYSMLGDADRISFNGNVDLANAASISVSRDQQRKQESDNQMMTSLIDAINGLSALIGNTGNVYNVNGVTYDDGSNVSTAVRSLLRAAKIEGRA